MSKRTLFSAVVVYLLTLAVAASAWAGETPIIAGHVWLDENADGVFEEGPEAGLEGVQVIFYRDYDCNGLIDGSDEIFDYDFSEVDGYYFVVNAYYCYVGFLNEETVPEGLVYTTEPFVSVITGQQDVLDVNFSLSAYEPYDIVCPQTANFWKKEFKKFKNFSAAELNLLVEEVLQLTPVFDNYAAIADVLQKGEDERDKEDKAERQFAALALNLAAASVHRQVGLQIGLLPETELVLPELTDAATVGDAFEQVEGCLLGGTEYKLAKKIAKSVNKGEGVALNCAE
jgi:hypothetical protein